MQFHTITAERTTPATPPEVLPVSTNVPRTVVVQERATEVHRLRRSSVTSDTDSIKSSGNSNRGEHELTRLGLRIVGKVH